MSTGSPSIGSAVLAVVSELMSEFAQRTGLASAAVPPRRYLWTDAFAVCNLLELFHASGQRSWLALALRLVDQVHEVLGRHREDDRRTGWISGLPEEEGRAHPTLGGLRIGKPRNERAPGEPFDERMEWDRDGQYFHYLTRWMHALASVARVTGEEAYLHQAIELAVAAHAGFGRFVPAAGRRGIVWKMSIDLTRPLVPSLGQHDPLDGLLTLRGLQADARRAGASAAARSLAGPIDDLRSSCAGCAGADWITDDALGIGGLLWDALRLARLAAEGDAEPSSSPELLADCATIGLTALSRSGALRGPASRRLAFRELGLTIGLHAAARMAESWGFALPDGLLSFLPLAEALEGFWLDPSNRATDPWRAHLDINAVMLATSLMPDGFLGPDPVPPISPRSAHGGP